jgi:hypothetical protein
MCASNRRSSTERLESKISFHLNHPLSFNTLGDDINTPNRRDLASSLPRSGRWSYSYVEGRSKIRDFCQASSIKGELSSARIVDQN